MTRELPLPARIAVAGVSFRQAAVCAVREGEPVRVAHDPSNPYDVNACAVRRTDGELLGYIPKSLTGRLLARGETRWVGRVAEVRDGGEVRGLLIELLPEVAPAEVAVIPAAVAPAAVTETINRVVRSRSGRVLGTLVGEDAESILVRNGAGGLVRYPAALVDVLP